MTKNRIAIWLDDVRNPNVKVSTQDDRTWADIYLQGYAKNEIVWIKSYDIFVAFIELHGLPEFICFDHDLGLFETGFVAAKWLTEYCLDRNIDIPDFAIQSSNVVGAENIRNILLNYSRHYHKNK